METLNITIIGAGIMGLSAAYTLNQRGHSVTIYERESFPANNASFKAGGMLAPYSEIEHMPQPWIEAGLSGINAWEDITKNIGDIGFEQSGSLFICHPEDRYVLERFATHLPQSEKLSADGIQNYEPDLQKRFSAGLFLKDEAHLNPQKAMQKISDYLLGRIAIKNETATPEDLSGTYNHVIDCRGMAANDPELRGVKGELAIVQNTEFKLSRPVRMMHPRYPLYIVPRADHTFMVGATMIESDGGERVNLRSAMELLSALYSLHPSFGDAEIIDIQAGIRPSYADNLPRIHTRANVISCNGLFRHGYLLAPVLAQAVADRLEGRDHAYMSLFEKGAQNADQCDNQRAA